ncbi:hypothetical protein JCM31598_24310 [Desulfonatronum parangueonense]
MDGLGLEQGEGLAAVTGFQHLPEEHAQGSSQRSPRLRIILGQENGHLAQEEKVVGVHGKTRKLILA